MGLNNVISIVQSWNQPGNKRCELCTRKAAIRPYLRTTDLNNSFQTDKPHRAGSSSQNMLLKARLSSVTASAQGPQNSLAMSGFKLALLKGEIERSFLAGSNRCSTKGRFPYVHLSHSLAESRA